MSAERGLLGCMMIDHRAGRKVEGLVSAADFADPNLGALYSEMQRMRRDGETVDVITVSGKLATVRGITPAEVHGWVDIPSSWLAAEPYADLIRADALRRGLLGVAEVITAEASKPDVAELVQDAQSRLAELVAGHAVRSLDAVPLGDVMDGPTDYEWVIPGLLERRDRVVVTGTEGGGKSTLVRQMAVSAAAGIHPFTWEPIEPIRCLVIDAENSLVQWRRATNRMLDRGRLEGSADPGAGVLLACTPRLDLTREQDLGQAQLLVERIKPDVVFIGPLYRLTPRAINSDDDAAPLLAALDKLREHGAAMVIEAHAGHALGAGGDRDLRPRGSSALLGWPEFGFGLRPLSQKDDAFGEADTAVVRWRGDRDERDWPDYLRRNRDFERGGWPWIPVETTGGSR